MKKVFLINPLVELEGKEHIHYLRDYSGGEIPTSMVYPPLDLAYIAAVLRKNNIAVTLLDSGTLHISNSETIKMIIGAHPDFIGIITAWGSIQSDLKLAEKLKTKLPCSKIVFAGSNVTADPKIALSTGCVDYVILGEPEKPFLDIVNGKINENIACELNGKIVLKKRKLINDLDWLPFPARDLLPNEKYIAPYVKINPFTTIATSRGCPHSKCDFCPTNIWYMNEVRYRSVDSVLQEIDEIINKFKIYSIIFRDQALTFEQERILKLCDEIIRRNYRISWRCFSGVKNVNKKLLLVMKKAGCYQINYGFESGSQEVLDLNNKGTTLEESIEAARLTKAAGIESSGSFMLGMWGDDEITINQTIAFAVKLNLDYAEFLIATPLPSTKFYEQCGLPQKINTFLFQRWYNRIHNLSTLLDEDFLNKYLEKAYKKFYFRPSYILNKLHKATSLKQLVMQAKLAMLLLKRVNNL
ncbi:MAG: radical SAM protein [Candidatus Omnitrophica bacterium]|nr:radical SAM protein [Candidatus Omnitrophota bacterium]